MVKGWVTPVSVVTKTFGNSQMVFSDAMLQQRCHTQKAKDGFGRLHQLQRAQLLPSPLYRHEDSVQSAGCTLCSHLSAMVLMLTAQLLYSKDNVNGTKHLGTNNKCIRT